MTCKISLFRLIQKTIRILDTGQISNGPIVQLPNPVFIYSRRPIDSIKKGECIHLTDLTLMNKLKDSLKDVNSIMKIDLEPHITIQEFKIIIKGSVSLENFDNRFIFDLILVADEFLLKELIGSLETYLIESKAHSKHPNIIFDSEDFNSLNENALISLIKHDNLQMEEITI
ncbi:hypothetical protein C2G38_2169427 [Gigaspora rosea]|uniref:Uncharacterized protein n=1 Tax=Gigaspora rosea TaxID=44941 RepID=A0A397VNL9_9GLOM|nr:hypothetical protein C2G38_2169427 [Gigaspora rosea]